MTRAKQTKTTTNKKVTRNLPLTAKRGKAVKGGLDMTIIPCIRPGMIIPCVKIIKP